MPLPFTHLLRTLALSFGLLVGWAAGSDPEAWTDTPAAAAAYDDGAGSTPTDPRFFQKP